jgi:hypothetical protein
MIDSQGYRAGTLTLWVGAENHSTGFLTSNSTPWIGRLRASDTAGIVFDYLPLEGVITKTDNGDDLLTLTVTDPSTGTQAKSTASLHEDGVALRGKTAQNFIFV